MGCERLREVHEYHDGRMSPAERAAFELHLADCPDCARLLHDLRSVSHLIVNARLPETAAESTDHYYEAWNLSRQRGLLRISSWLTAAAAAALLGSLVFWPTSTSPTDVATTGGVGVSAWEVKAVMPPPPEHGVDRPDELVELAQWMADDLSSDLAADTAPGGMR